MHYTSTSRLPRRRAVSVDVSVSVSTSSSRPPTPDILQALRAISPHKETKPDQTSANFYSPAAARMANWLIFLSYLGTKKLTVLENFSWADYLASHRSVSRRQVFSASASTFRSFLTFSTIPPLVGRYSISYLYNYQQLSVERDR